MASSTEQVGPGDGPLDCSDWRVRRSRSAVEAGFHLDVPADEGAGTVDSVERLTVAYKIRTVRIGVQATALVLLVLGAWVGLPGHPPINLVGYAVLMLMAAAGAAIAYLVVPWERLFLAGWGDPAMYVWSVLDIVLITLLAPCAGGANSPVLLLYPLTTVFFAVSYPERGQLALLGLTFGSYLTLCAMSSAPIPAADIALRMGALAIVWFIARFLSAERTQEMRANLDSMALAEHRADLLAAVNRAQAAISVLDPEQVMSRVVDSLVGIGFEIAVVYGLDTALSCRVLCSVGAPEGFVEAAHLSSEGMVGLVLRSGRTEILHDYSANPLALPELKNLDLQAMIAAPITVFGQIVAVLVAGESHSQELSGSDVEAFDILASQVGRALENARTYQMEQNLADQASADSLTDCLTGIGNRRQAEALLATLAQGDALVMIDLDRFKDVNDSLGHAAGDDVLCQVAEYLRTAIRDIDQVVRYGGEEFLVILHDVGDGALAAAQRLHEGWQALDPTTSFSAGVAVHADSLSDAALTVEHADIALYLAKEKGRDRVRRYEPGLGAEAGAKT
ncbi:MAG: GGDEF domain-containing protein [Acidimicrobiales bacterium]